MLEQVATVLEKLATYVDAVEFEKESALRESREKLADIFRDKFEEITGDTIDDDVLQKLSNADVDILAAFEKIAASNSADLGSPSDDMRDRSAPLTKKEASAAADEAFLDFIMGSGE